MEDPWIIWFLVGLGLIVGEFLVPGVVLVFLGLAAWIVAGLSFTNVVTSVPLQLVIFGAASVALAGSLRRVVMRGFRGDRPALPGGSDQQDEFAGKPVKILTEFDGPGATGKVEFKGAVWMARSEEEIHPGDTAEIVSVDGITLNVRRRWVPPFP